MEVSSELRLARRSLEKLDKVELFEDWRWQEPQKMWRLDLKLSPKVHPSEFVPEVTNWCILVSQNYPWGEINFFPFKNNSLTATFQHQNYNGESGQEKDWRNGKICLDTPVRSLGRCFSNDEPFSSEDRLCWHVERALQWLVLASQNKLSETGDPFELPYIPTIPHQPTIAFAESLELSDRWENYRLKAGKITFFRIHKTPDILVVKNYKGFQNTTIISNDWGKLIKNYKSDTKDGIWITIPSLPILLPWQIPYDWGELRLALHNQRIDINDLLFNLFIRKHIKGNEILLLGFPIPQIIGSQSERYQWLSLQMPQLHQVDKPIPGFRKNPKLSWDFNLKKKISDNSPILWLRSENWAYDQLNTRGKLMETLTDKKIALIGAGALGSAVGELLVRGGCTKIKIFDGDFLRAGNLVRHTLTLDDVGKYKAEALANRLNKISPFAEIDFANDSFPLDNPNVNSALKQSEIIIDCTGDDEVLYELNRFNWEVEKLFFSISLGVYAHRLFIFICRNNFFDADRFRSEMKSWLILEQTESSRFENFPREGIGCWHPVFPARSDDIWLMATTSVKILEEIASQEKKEFTQLIVYKQIFENGIFAGIRQNAIDEES